MLARGRWPGRGRGRGRGAEAWWAMGHSRGRRHPQRTRTAAREGEKKGYSLFWPFCGHQSLSRHSLFVLLRRQLQDEHDKVNT